MNNKSFTVIIICPKCNSTNVREVEFDGRIERICKDCNYFEFSDYSIERETDRYKYGYIDYSKPVEDDHLAWIYPFESFHYETMENKEDKL